LRRCVVAVVFSSNSLPDRVALELLAWRDDVVELARVLAVARFEARVADDLLELAPRIVVALEPVEDRGAPIPKASLERRELDRAVALVERVLESVRAQERSGETLSATSRWSCSSRAR
jgi:hypothetical protein